MAEREAKQPLEGARILDLTQMGAGPYATMLFADAGAEVIKIERPGVGDLSREFGPWVQDAQGQRVGGGFLRFNRNKKSVTLDLKKAAGQDIFKALVGISAVVWENFSPGTMDRLGLGYEVLRAVNPSIIYATVSGFGHTDLYPSPYWQRPAFDAIAQAMGGLMDITGDPEGPPVMVGTIVGDLVPSIFAAYGVMVALYDQKQTGQGRRVDVSMYDSIAALCERQLIAYSLTGEVITRGKEIHAAPYSAFKVKDGYIVITAATQAIWARLCQAMGREDLISHPLLATALDRSRNFASFLKSIMDAWLADKTKREAMEILVAHDVPAGPVQTVDEVFHCPHIAARQMLVEIEHPVAGKYKMTGNPAKLSHLPQQPAAPPPLLGQHTEEVLRELLGLSAERIAQLRAKGVI